jgi:hypothetical protein
MADNVHFHHAPPRRSGPSALVWAFIVLVLVAVIAWLVLGRQGDPGVPDEIDVNIEAPGVPTPR